VTFAQPFAVGAFAVAFDEWDACVADGGLRRLSPVRSRLGPWPPSGHQCFLGRRDGLCAMAVAQDGKDVPAAERSRTRICGAAGTTTPFWWGSSISTEQANYDGNLVYGGGPKGEYRQRTSPVEVLPAKSLGSLPGARAMYWNGRRIVRTITTMEHVDGSAWTSGDCSRRALRGGSWYFSPDFARAAFRVRLYSVNRTSTQKLSGCRTLNQGNRVKESCGDEACEELIIQAATFSAEAGRESLPRSSSIQVEANVLDDGEVGGA